MADPVPPKMLGPYELAELLGEGGMGAVWRAHHRALKRWVALKVFTAPAADPHALRRFVREMRLLGSIHHPHFVQVLDGGEDGEHFYYVMELVEGRTLQSLSDEHGPLAWPFALALARGVADGLAYLHEQGVVHRDVKPANVMLSADGVVKLLDLGIARDTAATAITVAGQIPGTATYLAPENVRGEPATPASDLWALGLVLYLLLTGQSPIPVASLEQVLAAILAGPLPPPDEVCPGLPAPVVQIAMGLVCRDQRHRTATAAQVRDRIDAVLAAAGESGWESHLGPGVLSRIPKPVRTPARRPGSSGRGVAPPQLAPEAPGDETPTLPLRQPEPTPGAGRRTRRSGLPTSSPRRSQLMVMAPLCVLVLAAALAAIGAHLRRENSVASPSSRESFAASPAVPASPSHGVNGPDVTARTPAPLPSMPPLHDAPLRPAGAPPDRLLDRFKLVQPLLARLEQGERPRDVVSAMRERAGVDLGPAPASWIYWVQLGRWLEGDPARHPPPRPGGSLKGPLDWVELSTLRTELKLRRNAPGPGLTSLTLRTLAARPDDGSSWLLLGLVLEHEGRPHDARAVYRWAFDRLQDVEMDALDVQHWIALLRGLLLRGRPVEVEWWRYATRTANGRDWTALRVVLPGCEPALVARFEESAQKLPVLDEHAITWLAERARQRGDIAGARRIWTAGRAHLPASRFLVGMEVEYNAARGDLAAALADAPLVQRNWALIAHLGWLARPLDPLPPSSEPSDLYARLEVHGMLARGEPAAAATYLQSPALQKGDDTRVVASGTIGRLSLDVLGAGSDAGPIISAALDHLERTTGEGEWLHAAGVLSSPPGQRWFREALARARARGSKLPLDWFEAAWHGRSRRPRECAALLGALLGGAPDRTFTPEIEQVAAELLANPALNLDTTLSAPPASRPPGQLIAHLRAGRTADALALARAQLDREPHRVLWPLAVAWLDPREIPRMELVLRYHFAGSWALAALKR